MRILDFSNVTEQVCAKWAKTNNSLSVWDQKKQQQQQLDVGCSGPAPLVHIDQYVNNMKQPSNQKDDTGDHRQSSMQPPVCNRLQQLHSITLEC